MTTGQSLARLAVATLVAVAVVLAGPADVRAADVHEPVSIAAFPVGDSFDPGERAEEFATSDAGPASAMCSELCPSNTWQVTADVLFLQRRDPAAAVLIASSLDGAELLNAGDFDFGVEPGFDLSLTYRFDDRFAIQARYFGVDHWNARSAAATAPDSLLQVNASPPVFAWAGTGIQSESTSALQNAELNAQRRVLERWTLLAGFRYAELDERFSAGLVAADIPFHYETATRNRLYGGQLGVGVLLWDRGGPLTVQAEGKAGIFGNAAAQDSAYDTGVVAVAARGSGSQTAFLGEIGLLGDCCLTSRWSLRGGYRLLWIDGVALATDQVAASDFVSNRGMNTIGDAFYHGAFVGIQYVR